MQNQMLVRKIHLCLISEAVAVRLNQERIKICLTPRLKEVLPIDQGSSLVRKPSERTDAPRSTPQSAILYDDTHLRCTPTISQGRYIISAIKFGVIFLVNDLKSNAKHFGLTLSEEKSSYHTSYQLKNPPLNIKPGFKFDSLCNAPASTLKKNCSAILPRIPHT